MVLLHLVQHVMELAPVLQQSQASLGHVLTYPLTALDPLPKADGTPVPAPITGGNNSLQDLENFANTIEAFASTFGYSVFVIGVCVAGITRMVANGSEYLINKSNQSLIAAIVGLALVLMATGFSTLLKGSFQPH